MLPYSGTRRPCRSNWKLAVTLAALTWTATANESGAQEGRPTLEDAQLTEWFVTPQEQREDLGIPFDAYQNLSREEAAALRERVWNAWRVAAIAKGWEDDVRERRVRHGEYAMPYVLKTRGERGPQGWPLTVTLHGGGTAPKQVNDRDWKHHQMRYEPQGKFVALRSPRDNQIWHPYIYPMLQTLYAQLILFEDVDPNRIMITGFSEGGYSVYRQFADMPDCYAAMAASGAGGILEKCPAENLSNTAVILQVGEHDNGFRRSEYARRYAETLYALQAQHPEAFTHKFVLHEGRGHSIDDRQSIPWMAEQSRDPHPKHVWWTIGPWHQPLFRFWLGLSEPEEGQAIKARIDGQTLDVWSTNVETVAVFLSDELLDLDQPVAARFNETEVFRGVPSRNVLTMMESTERRGDPTMLWSAQLSLSPRP